MDGGVVKACHALGMDAAKEELHHCTTYGACFHKKVSVHSVTRCQCLKKLSPSMCGWCVLTRESERACAVYTVYVYVCMRACVL